MYKKIILFIISCTLMSIACDITAFNIKAIQCNMPSINTHNGIFITGSCYCLGGLYLMLKKPRKEKNDSPVERITRIIGGPLLCSAGLLLIIKNKSVADHGFFATVKEVYSLAKNNIFNT